MLHIDVLEEFPKEFPEGIFQGQIGVILLKYLEKCPMESLDEVSK